LISATLQVQPTKHRSRKPKSTYGMPPARLGEPHDGSYRTRTLATEDATALCGGDSRLLLLSGSNFARANSSDALLSGRDHSTFSSKRESPPGKPVASKWFLQASVAASVNLHRASRWHPKWFFQASHSCERESPPGKPVASEWFFIAPLSCERESPPGKPVASEMVFIAPLSCERESPPGKPVASEMVLPGLS